MIHSENLIHKKILVIGIDSFTGKYLSSYLQECGYDLYGTTLTENSHKKYKCDITSKSDIINILEKVEPDYIIHLAGISFPAHGNNQDFYNINTIGATNVLDAVLELSQNPSKIILVSSATVYGNQGLEILDESLCPKPSNHYGASKYAMECVARAYFEKLPIVITRPFNYTGIGQAEHFLIPKIVKHYKEKKNTIELGNLDVSREFNDIDYVCEVYKRLLECKARSEIVNICSGEARKLLDVIDTMNHLAGYKIKVEVNAAFVRKGEIKSLTGSTQKLFKLIGIVEQKSFEETLRGMLEA